jgi:hypothetical protein
MVAILKILITKITTLSDDLFLCQVSKGSAVRFEFNIFCTLVTMATVTILIINNNNNKKRCKHNKSPNFVWGLNNLASMLLIILEQKKIFKQFVLSVKIYDNITYFLEQLQQLVYFVQYLQC